MRIVTTMLSYPQSWFWSNSVKVRPTIRDKLLNRDNQKDWCLGRRGNLGPSRWWPGNPILLHQPLVIPSPWINFPGQVRFESSRVRFTQKGRKGLEDNSKSFSALIEKSISRLNGMISQKGGRPLIGVLIRDLGWVGGRISRSRCALVVTFVRMCHHLHKHEGMKGLVYYLKTSYVLIQQAVAGYIVEDLTPLKRRVRRDRSGFPLWIPLVQRHLLRKKDLKAIRFWTSLVSIYRVLSFPSRVDLSSIISPGVDWIRNVGIGPWREGLEQAITLFWHKVEGSALKKELKEKPLDFFAILKASPFTATSWFTDKMLKMEKPPRRLPKTQYELMRRWGKLVTIPIVSTNYWAILQAAYAIMTSPIKEVMMIYAADAKNFFEFFSQLNRCSIIADPPPFMAGTPTTLSDFRDYLGRLGLKDEPAGKVRVFAMVDCWTQWLLYPLHKILQVALRKISEDATFDQVGKMEEKLELLARKYRKGKAFSFDLSSATDRLPVGLQVSILTPLLGHYEAKAWASILIDRDYALPERARRDTGSLSVRYEVGQPMGAYSSWVMLAVTHHVIIQWAAWVVGKVGWTRWFSDYVVLGDDVVIFDPIVAAAYYHVMTELLGVKIGLAKSIKSYNGFILEFAKKFWVKGKRCFVVPLRDCIVSCLSTDTLSEFMHKHNQDLNSYLRMRGLGFRSRSKYRNNFWAMPNRLRVYLITWAFGEREFMDWVSMKSLSDHYEITWKGIQSFIEELHLMRSELVARLERRRSPVMSDFEKLTSKPFYSHTSVLDEMLRVGEYNQLLNSMRLRGIPSYLGDYDEYKLRDLLWEILGDIQHLEAEMEDLPENSFLRWEREDERPFHTISDLYLKWVRLNRCFSKHQDPAEPADVKGAVKSVPSSDAVLCESDSVTPNIDVANVQPEPSIWVTKWVTYWFFDQWEPDTLPFAHAIWLRFWRGYVMWALEFGFGAAVAAMVLGWLPWPSGEEGAETVSTVSTSPVESTSDSPSSASGLLTIWLSFLLGFFGIGFILLLLGMVTPVDEFLSFRELLSEMYNYHPAPYVLVDSPLEDAHPFRFPTMSELIDWQNSSRDIPSITRSPEMGHGWSEPWSFNESWPEQWR